MANSIRKICLSLKLQVWECKKSGISGGDYESIPFYKWSSWPEEASMPLHISQRLIDSWTKLYTRWEISHSTCLGVKVLLRHTVSDKCKNILHLMHLNCGQPLEQYSTFKAMAIWGLLRFLKGRQTEKWLQILGSHGSRSICLQWVKRGQGAEDSVGHTTSS